MKSIDISRREAVISSEVDGLTVVEIKEYAFIDHEDLETVVIPTSVTKIGNEVFFGCNNLKELNIPYSVTDIGLKFFGAHHLAAINVDADNPVYSSYEGILYNKDRTKLLLIPQGVEGHLVIPEGVVEIGASAAEYGCKAETVSFPSTLERIGNRAFVGNHFKDIIYPEDCHLKEIGVEAFSACFELSKQVLPESLEHIGRGSFSSGLQVKALYLPQSLQYTDGEEFGWYYDLEEVHIQAQDPPMLGSSTFVRTTNPFIQWIPRYLYVPQGCREKYEAADWWRWNFYILEEGQDRSEAGIDSVINDADESRSKCYDLMGRQSRPDYGPGIMIKNGRKTIIDNRY